MEFLFWLRVVSGLWFCEGNIHTIIGIRCLFAFSGGFPQTWPRWKGDPDSIPGSGRSPGEGSGNSLQYSYLENSMSREVCRVIGHRVTKNCVFSEAITEFIKKSLEAVVEIYYLILCFIWILVSSCYLNIYIYIYVFISPCLISISHCFS